jgi:general secretion pathway protein D
MSFNSGKEDDPTLVKPMASFDQEPVFETPPKGGAAKPATENASQNAAAKSATKASAPNLPPPYEPPSAKAANPASPQKAPVPAATAASAPAATPGSGENDADAVEEETDAAAKPVAKPAAVSAPQTAPQPPPVAVPPQPGTPPGMPPAAPSAPPPVITLPAAANPPAAPKRGLVQIAAPAGIAIGQQFYVDVKTADVADLAAAPFVLTYDPRLVEYVSATEGVFLKKDGKPILFSPVAAGSTGAVNVALSRAPNSGGVTGAGTLVSLLFKAKAKGTASFGFRSVNFTAADGKPVEVLPFSTAVDVR